jgi:regulation of enolase protein 1 (concanavalin A-like superfamily)
MINRFGARWQRLAAGLAALGLGAAAGPAERGGVLFHDSFKNKLAGGWSWVREDPKRWRATERGLEVCIHPGNMWGPANDAKNVLVRPVPEAGGKPLEITASVENRPTNQWEQVDLVWYYDDGHMVKLGQELVDGKLSVVMGREEDDRARTISITPLDSDAVELRIVVSNGRVRGRFKTPKADWRDVGECDLPAKGEPKISLQFYRGPEDAEHWARVSDLTVRRAD